MFLETTSFFPKLPNSTPVQLPLSNSHSLAVVCTTCPNFVFPKWSPDPVFSNFNNKRLEKIIFGLPSSLALALAPHSNHTIGSDGMTFSIHLFWALVISKIFIRNSISIVYDHNSFSMHSIGEKMNIRTIIRIMSLLSKLNRNKTSVSFKQYLLFRDFIFNLSTTKASILLGWREQCVSLTAAKVTSSRPFSAYRQQSKRLSDSCKDLLEAVAVNYYNIKTIQVISSIDFSGKLKTSYIKRT